MVNFYIYDIAFLVLFSLVVFLFLYKRRRKLEKEGIIYLYRTKLGIKAINYFGDNYKKTLHVLKYFVVALGFILMFGIVSLLGMSVHTYISEPEISEITSAPPVAPLVPYFPEIFGLESFFPPFYFAYFLIALAIVAMGHEFAHGIYMRLFKIKIKSTGFAFLSFIGYIGERFYKFYKKRLKMNENKLLSLSILSSIIFLILYISFFIMVFVVTENIAYIFFLAILFPILGAFVEQDDKQMTKKKNIEQMTTLGAGTFANVLMFILFFLAYVLFFHITFTPSGALFDSYAYNVAPIQDIEVTDNDLINKTVFLGGRITNLNLSEVIYEDEIYYIGPRSRGLIEEGVDENVMMLKDAPAFREGLIGAIIYIEGEEIKSGEDLSKIMETRKPGDVIEIKTIDRGEERTYEITLDEHPENSDRGYLGISSVSPLAEGFLQKMMYYFINFKDPNTHYSPIFNGDLVVFILNMIWWIMIINILVALFNMLPLGFLDGGRFFYLTVLSITGSEKISKQAFKLITMFILFIFLFLVFIWLFRVV